MHLRRLPLRRRRRIHVHGRRWLRWLLRWRLWRQLLLLLELLLLELLLLELQLLELLDLLLEVLLLLIHLLLLQHSLRQVRRNWLALWW